MAAVFKSLIGAAILGLLAAPLTAAAGEVRCPESHGGARLTTVSIFDGPPSEQADLVPDRIQKTGRGTRSEWDVAYLFKLGRQPFVECHYGDKAATVVLQPGPTTYECDFLAPGGDKASLICKSH